MLRNLNDINRYAAELCNDDKKRMEFFVRADVVGPTLAPEHRQELAELIAVIGEVVEEQHGSR